MYLWGGGQDSLPSVHSSAKKRLLLSVVDIFNIETGKKSLISTMFTWFIMVNFSAAKKYHVNFCEFHSVFSFTRIVISYFLRGIWLNLSSH